MGTVTGKIPISPLINLVGIFILFKRNLKLNKYFLPLLLLMLYCTMQILILEPQSLVKYAFYRYDGNIFPSYLPLLFLSIFAVKFDFYKLIDFYIKFTLSILIIFNFLFPFSTFYAHNALGGFVAEIVCIVTGILYVNLLIYKNISLKYIFFLTIAAFILIKSDSRGSILGALLSIFFVLILPKWRWKFFGFSLLIIFFIELIYIYPYWLKLGKPFSFFEYKEIQLNIEGFRWWTIIDRVFYLWPRALYDWLISPIFGIGFSKYNDIPYNFIGIKHFISFNIANPIYSDYHAHNSFLHFLAETGILGLVLLIYTIYSLDRFIKLKLNNPFEKYVLLLLLWYLVFASLTEHRFTTPSQAIPFSILMGIAVANYNYQNKILKFK